MYSSVQDCIYAHGKNPYALHPVSQTFLQRCHGNGSNVRLTDDGPLLSFQGRSSSTSSFHDSLLQAVDGVMSLALYPQILSQASQHFRSFSFSCDHNHLGTLRDCNSLHILVSAFCWQQPFICVKFEFTELLVPRYTYNQLSESCWRSACVFWAPHSKHRFTTALLQSLQ